MRRDLTQEDHPQHHSMHTVGSRANTIVYYGAMVLLVALMANVATSYFCFSYDVPNIDVKLNKIDKLYVACIVIVCDVLCMHVCVCVFSYIICSKKENKRGIEQDVATIVFDLQAGSNISQHTYHHHHHYPLPPLNHTTNSLTTQMHQGLMQIIHQTTKYIK